MAEEIRFVSSNPYKIAEANQILAPEFKIVPLSTKINEIQTSDASQLIRDKVLKAFGNVGRPVFVEHTGLYLSYLNGLPGGLTQVFWDALEADRFADLFGRPSQDRSAVARTNVAFCDGRRVFEWEGSVNGRIAEKPRGPRDFQWDCVFEPEGENETFAEMGPRKNSVSMRRAALDRLRAHLKG